MPAIPFQAWGSFVAAKDTEVIREGNLRIAEEYLTKAADLAKKSGISLKELMEVLELIYNGEWGDVHGVRSEHKRAF